LRMYVSHFPFGPSTHSQMSHRLKLNAVHFANSLEDEKSLLDTSTEVLESKLDISYHWYLADNGRESGWNEGLEEASLDRIE